MASLTINFKKVIQSNPALGQYESFVGIDESTDITMDPPTGWAVKGINVYDLASASPPSNDKRVDINALRRPRADWANIFSRTKPTGFSYAANSSVLVDAGDPNAPDKSYEYLVWIQKGADNDFIDPGLKNNF